MQSATQQQPALQMKDGRSIPITTDQQRDLEMLNLQAQNIALQGELLKRNAEDVQQAINAILAAAIEADKVAQAANDEALAAAKPRGADVIAFPPAAAPVAEAAVAAAPAEAALDVQPA